MSPLMTATSVPKSASHIIKSSVRSWSTGQSAPISLVLSLKSYTPRPPRRLNNGTHYQNICFRTYSQQKVDARGIVRGSRKEGFHYMRWTGRGISLTLIGCAIYFFYDIYQLRHPPDQPGVDLEKQNLVILGTGWGAVSLLKALDSEHYNITVISPRNYFLFTPLLPSCTTGTVEHRSIMEPIRSILRHKKTATNFYEAEARHIDPLTKVITLDSGTQVPYDKLIVAVGGENATFGIPGVRENACFLKEIGDAQEIRKRIMDCVESATFKGQPPEEVERLLHMVVVGGGPTGVEFAGELQDFFEQDIKKWVPEVGDKFRVTLIEALPNVLPMFSKQLIDYTESTLKEEKITIKTKTTVKRVGPKTVEAESSGPGGKTTEAIPYGLLVWATGNAARPIIKDLISQIPAQKDSRRGLLVDNFLAVQGVSDIWAIGDCAIAGYAPTAQVASQQAAFLARQLGSMVKTKDLEDRIQELNELPGISDRAAELQQLQKRLKVIGKPKPFHYSHQGSLAYIGGDQAVADIPWFNGNFATGGQLTYLFWRSAYLSMCFSTRNRVLVVLDWLKSKAFGRDVARE